VDSTCTGVSLQESRCQWLIKEAEPEAASARVRMRPEVAQHGCPWVDGPGFFKLGALSPGPLYHSVAAVSACPPSGCSFKLHSLRLHWQY
jgi:hypothetical protein